MIQKLPIGFRLIALFSLSLLFTSCKVGRFVYYNFADIDDYKKFPNRTLIKSDQPFEFHSAKNPRFPKELNVNDEKFTLDEYLIRNNTVAFLIIQNDSIQYENYFHQKDESSIVPSFSVAKSVTSILIGCAVDDGLIQSVQDPITKYLPELSKNGFDKVTIEHVLQMTSGLNFNESYFNPFGHAASFYYGRNLRKEVSKLKLKQEPGKSFEYTSGNTQLLGMLLEKVLNGKTITEYLQEKLWTPLQMEFDASWSLDREKNGVEKTFCCLNARARDFAKIGRLYLNKGNWNGKQIVSENWVETSTKVETSNGSAWQYQYQWWLPTQTGDYMAHGILGQYIYVNPMKNLVIVRLGSSEGNVEWSEVFTTLSQGYN